MVEKRSVRDVALPPALGYQSTMNRTLVVALAATVVGCIEDRDLCAEFGLVENRVEDRCVCPTGTTEREDGDGCDLPDGGFIAFPDAAPPDAARDGGSGADDSGVLDAETDAPAVPDAGTETIDASACDTSTETCDGTDNDCDGLIDEATDLGCPATSACTRGACVSGRCVGVLIDEDGDGFASATLGACGLDCDDSDDRVFPGQTEYFVEPRADGGWDYDCSGGNDLLFPDGTLGSCNMAIRPCQPGWSGTFPFCGDIARYIARSDCAARICEIEDRQQRCR
jgi:hypothetical protein